MSTHDGSAPERLRVLTAVVEDHPGVLTRVSGMIRRRGFNIQSLSVGPTDAPGRSRLTLTVDAGHAEVDQVQKQLDRLVEVIEVDRFGGRVVDVGPGHVIVEVSGEFDRVESFLEALRPYAIVELARSGPV